LELEAKSPSVELVDLLVEKLASAGPEYLLVEKLASVGPEYLLVGELAF
jgi:hypothetical protein